MASIMRQAMNYLGLGPDESYEPQPLEHVPEVPEPPLVYSDHSHSAAQPADTGSVRVLQRPDLASSEEMDVDEPPLASPGVIGRPASPARPTVVNPRVFDDAQKVADRFKQSQAVILNLQGLDDDTARRLLDFASGLCYGRDGSMSRVANSVYLLVPANVVVPDGVHRRTGYRS